MTDEIGLIDVSDEVIRSIVELCSREVPGIASVSEEGFINGAFKMLRSSDHPRGIRITNGADDSHKKVDVSVQIEFGVAIPSVAIELQRKIKSQVERITGIVVDEVNVHIDGVQATQDTTSSPRVVTPPPSSGAVQSTDEGDNSSRGF